MDKFSKNAAIYLVRKNEKEDGNFLTQKIKKLERNCQRNDIEMKEIFIATEMETKEKNLKQWESLKEQIKKHQIEVLIVEEEEDVLPLDAVEIEKVAIS